MTRRCKPGQRARVLDGVNVGRIVLVVKPLFSPDNEFDGSHWPRAIYPWVVASLGAPLRALFINTNKEAPPRMMIVMCDTDLEPLDDDDDGLRRDTDTSKPKKRPKVQPARKPVPAL